MRKFALPVLTVFILFALVSVPAMAVPAAAPALAQPAGTASPRDWDKIAPESILLPTAIKAESAILIDEKTGEILFEKDADKRQYPASITKIMTCLLAMEYIENGHKMSELVTIGDLPPLRDDYVSINLKKNETVSLETLLYALMIVSANDAANAIAIHIGGDMGTFLKMMNDKAIELGMSGTHYTNPYGLHDADHYTTARDMALLAKEAMKYPNFTKLVSTTSYTAPATNKRKSQKWETHNYLINPSNNNPYGYLYATGVKTGNTTPAKNTFVSSAKKNNTSLIAVVLKDEKRTNIWTDSVTMFEYGFRYFDTLDLRKFLADQPIEPLAVKNAAGSDPGMGSLQLLLRPITPNAYITDRKEVIEQLKNDPSQFVPAMVFSKDTAPIAEDELLGTVTFTYKEKVVLQCEILAAREVKERPTPAPTPTPSIAETAGNPAATARESGSPAAPGGTTAPRPNGEGIGSALLWIGGIVLALLLAAVVIRLLNVRRRNRKYSQYNWRQGGSARMRR